MKKMLTIAMFSALVMPMMASAAPDSGNDDYFEITQVKIGEIYEASNGIINGTMTTPADAATYAKDFKMKAQRVCDAANGVMPGQSKIELLNYSSEAKAGDQEAYRGKTVKIGMRVICHLK